MLNFPLKKHWYNEIESGRKNTEYRKAGNYWGVRLAKIKMGDVVSFSMGYTKQRIEKRVLGVSLLETGIDTDLKCSEPVYAIYLIPEREKEIKKMLDMYTKSYYHNTYWKTKTN